MKNTVNSDDVMLRTKPSLRDSQSGIANAPTLYKLDTESLVSMLLRREILNGDFSEIRAFPQETLQQRVAAAKREIAEVNSQIKSVPTETLKEAERKVAFWDRARTAIGVTATTLGVSAGLYLIQVMPPLWTNPNLTDLTGLAGAWVIVVYGGIYAFVNYFGEGSDLIKKEIQTRENAEAPRNGSTNAATA